MRERRNTHSKRDDIRNGMRAKLIRKELIDDQKEMRDTPEEMMNIHKI